MKQEILHVLRKQRQSLFNFCYGVLYSLRPFPIPTSAQHHATTLPHSKSSSSSSSRHHDRRRNTHSNTRRDLSTSPPPRKCRVYNITGGIVPYDQAWMWQQRLLRERMAWQRAETRNPGGGACSNDVLLLLEHSPVYTLGRGSSLDHLRFDPTDPSSSCGREVRRTERGGEVTWHGPGQIVGYPVLDLNFHKKDLHWYLRQLEEVVIRVLRTYGLEGERETEHTGVWVGGAKVAAIGLNASRWVTSHGFAFNVDPDLRAFEAIVPCGIKGRPVTRLCDLVGSGTAPVAGVERTGEGADAGSGTTPAGAEMAIDASSVRLLMMQEFRHVFCVELEVVDVDASGDTGNELERKIFSADCEPALLERLRSDSRRQLELTRPRR